MRTWNLGIHDPLQLTLAADARVSSPDYLNDQIWEVTYHGGEPPSLAVETNYGLRARWMRIFPRFIYKDLVRTDPAGFYQPPYLNKFFPNYLAFTFAPFAGIECIMEYWVPGSQVIAGRMKITNRGQSVVKLHCEWVTTLNAVEGGHAMLPTQVNETRALCGQTDQLMPVCVMLDHPEVVTAPYPAFYLDLELASGESRHTSWATAATNDQQQSFDLAQITLKRPWDAEISYLELLNDSQSIDITTGNPEWDAAFALSQKTARGLFFTGNRFLPFSSFVRSRKIDHGFSRSVDGSDYSHLWNGQTPMDAYFMASLLLPGEIDLTEGLLRNFISTVGKEGNLDWKPGLNGQRSHLPATPMLASLAVEIDRCKDNHDWLTEIYPVLLKHFSNWFEPPRDKDRDGYPEWEHALQTGFEDHPLYDRWHAHSQAVDIGLLECPSLLAFLYKECTNLKKIAGWIGEDEDIPRLEEKLDLLRTLFSETWNPSAGVAHPRDYQAHKTDAKVKTIHYKGNGLFTARLSFSYPCRLNILFIIDSENPQAITLRLTGESEQEQTSEIIENRRISWNGTQGRATTQSLFSKISSVEISGVNKSTRCYISSIDYSKIDISLLLPLWAEILSKQNATVMLTKAYHKHLLQNCGLINYEPSSADEADQPISLRSISIPWNNLIGEGLINYGFYPEAAELFTRLMNVICKTLREEHAFFEFYDARNGRGAGERNDLRGLAPIGLFLHIIGVQLPKNNEVILQGQNPFPWPVTIRFRGCFITRHVEDTVITFSTGQAITVTGPGPHRVTLI